MQGSCSSRISVWLTCLVRRQVAERDPVQVENAHRERDVQGIQGLTASALGGAQSAYVVVAPGDVQCGSIRHDQPERKHALGRDTIMIVALAFAHRAWRPHAGAV